MDVGVQMFSTDRAIRPDALARETEARGFDALFLPEHTHIPTSRRTPYPGGGELPEHEPAADDRNPRASLDRGSPAVHSQFYEATPLGTNNSVRSRPGPS